MVSDSFGPSAKGLQTFIGGGYGIGHTASSAGLSEGGAERLGLLPPLLAYSPQFNDAERDVRSGRVDSDHRPPGPEPGYINNLRASFTDNTRLARLLFGPYLDPKGEPVANPAVVGPCLDPDFHVGQDRQLRDVENRCIGLIRADHAPLIDRQAQRTRCQTSHATVSPLFGQRGPVQDMISFEEATSVWRKAKRFAFIVSLALFVLAALTLAADGLIIGSSVRRFSHKAQSQFPGNRTEALIALVKCQTCDVRERNHAVWTLGQLDDHAALPVLESCDSGKCGPLAERRLRIALRHLRHQDSNRSEAFLWRWMLAGES